MSRDIAINTDKMWSLRPIAFKFAKSSPRRYDDRDDRSRRVVTVSTNASYRDFERVDTVDLDPNVDPTTTAAAAAAAAAAARDPVSRTVSTTNGVSVNANASRSDDDRRPQTTDSSSINRDESVATTRSDGDSPTTVIEVLSSLDDGDDYDYPVAWSIRPIVTAAAASKGEENATRIGWRGRREGRTRSTVARPSLRLDVIAPPPSQPLIKERVLLDSIDDASTLPVSTVLLRLLALCTETEGLYHYDRGERRRGDDDSGDESFRRRRLIVGIAYARSEECLANLLSDRRVDAAATTTTTVSATANHHDASSYPTVVLYRESKVRLVTLLSLCTEGRVSCVRSLLDDVPLTEQYRTPRVTTLPGDFVRHDGNACAHHCCDVTLSGAVVIGCVACLNAIWLDVQVDDDSCEGERSVSGRSEILAAPRFFFHRRDSDLSSEHRCVCVWHTWSEAHIHCLRHFFHYRSTATLATMREIDCGAAALTLTNDATRRYTLFHDICRDGFYTCGVYEVAFAEECRYERLPPNDNVLAATNENCLLVFQRHFVTIVAMRPTVAYHRYWYSAVIDHRVTADALQLRIFADRDKIVAGGRSLLARTVTVRPKRHEALSHIALNFLVCSTEKRQ